MVIGNSFSRYLFPPPTRITQHLKGIFRPEVRVLVWVYHELYTSLKVLDLAFTDLVENGTKDVIDAIFSDFYDGLNHLMLNFDGI